MSNLFDDLFSQFFGKKNNKKESEKKHNSENELNPNPNNKFNDIEKLIDLLSNSNGLDESVFSQKMDQELGEPNSVEYYEEDGMYFERKTWKGVFGGDVIKTAISDHPFKKENKTLDELLLEAIDSENYEEAARLRDEISKQKEIENQ